MSPSKLSLFQAFGIELEYMVVDRDTLRPAPIAESILLDENGETVQEISLGAIDVSNELATHVLEFKTSGPVSDLAKLTLDFQEAIALMNERLAPHNAMLAPSGMHPFMDPKVEGKTWSQGDRTIYETYDRIFNCSSHGWFNLQSCHINLPFSNEEEFGRLHAAVILVLPFLPALAASSPFVEGKLTGFLDTRLNVYKENQKKVPQIAGEIMPEAVFTFEDYQTEILEKTYAAIKPYDPDGILQYEWLNSRGAIARFDRNAIEIRVLDTQENPTQDIAIASLIIALLEHLCALSADQLLAAARKSAPSVRRTQFFEVARDGFEADLSAKDLGELLDLSPKASSVGELWAHVLDLLEETPRVSPHLEKLKNLLQEGCLSERLIQRYGKNPDENELKSYVAELADCLANGKLFESSPISS